MDTFSCFISIYSTLFVRSHSANELREAFSFEFNKLMVVKIMRKHDAFQVPGRDQAALVVAVLGHNIGPGPTLKNKQIHQPAQNRPVDRIIKERSAFLQDARSLCYHTIEIIRNL